MKEKNAKQWKDFNRQAARVFEIRDPDGFRTRAALCLALLLLRRGRENRLRATRERTQSLATALVTWPNGFHASVLLCATGPRN